MTQPLTGLGRLIQNKWDTRKRPVHGGTDISQITFMAVMLRLKHKYCISEEDMNELLLLFQKMSPSDNLIPQTMVEIDRLTKDLLVQHEEHVVCSCEEYRFNAQSAVCPVCHSAKGSGTKYYTIPIGPRIQQIKEVASLSRLTAVMETIPKKTRFVSDLHESPGWSEFHQIMGDNAIALSYCSDGFNPFHHIVTQGSYSIWAQSSLILNLPAQLRVKTGTTLLLGLISGPRAPKKLNMYNEVIVNELAQLKEGITTYNADTKKLEQTKVGIMFMVGDVPGIAKEQNRVQQNAKNSCGHCTIQGVHSNILDKTVYPGGRCFLKENHPLRQDITFPSGKVELRVVEKRTLSNEVTDSRYLDVLHKEKIEGKSTNTLSAAFAQQTGRYGSNHWFRLGLDLQQRHAPIEPMHAIKVVGEHLVKLLNGEEDGVKVRAEERNSGRQPDLCPDDVYRLHAKEKKTLGQKRKKVSDDSSNNLETRFPKSQLPPAPYVLTPSERKEADKRLGDIKITANFGVLPTTLFVKIVGGTKCHTWLQLMTTGILRYCLRGMLGEQQRSSLFRFLFLLEKLYCHTIDMELLDDLEEQWHECLCMMEKTFPVSLQTFYFHLLHHLPQYLRLYGPTRNFWMFPYERFNHTLTEAVSSNHHPEISAVKKIEVQWLISMLDSSGYLATLKKAAVASMEVSLSTGRHRLVNRLPTVEEIHQLPDYVPGTTVKVFHFCQTNSQKYRGSLVETEKEKPSMVIYNSFLGQTQYFLEYGTRSFAWIKWIGNLSQDTDSLCYYTSVQNVTPANLLLVQHLSPPVLHAQDGETTWVPAMPF